MSSRECWLQILRVKNVLLIGLVSFATLLVPTPGQASQLPHILLITVDTLRADHLSGYGYKRQTSPHLDQLMEEGARFTQARTVIPLTCPALASMFTSLQPHEHGSTRNGLPIRERLPSLPKLLARAGYMNAAFVSNSVLREDLCGLHRHFDIWEEILTRKRLFFTWREAHADDVTDQGLAFIEKHLAKDNSPFFAWLHYVEPHFPYQLQTDYLEQIGVGRGRSAFSPRNRYDSEIARVDASIGHLLREVRDRVSPNKLMVIFTSDHGESLGNHGYWGHGKYVYDTGLHIPLSITWPGHIEPRLIEAPAVNVDLPATVLSLLGMPVPDFFAGFDFAQVMRGEIPEPLERVTFFQAHKSSVLASEKQRANEIRPEGLNEVGMVRDGKKEIFRVRSKNHRLFDLREDTGERTNLATNSSSPSEELLAWLTAVQDGLHQVKGLAVPQLDEDTVKELQALGYGD